MVRSNVRREKPEDEQATRLGETAGRGGSQAVGRALDVLDLLARGPTGVGETARALGVNKSTASRILATLANRGYAARDGDGGQYRLGGKIAELYGTYLAGFRLGRDYRRMVERVAEATGETVLLTSLEDGIAVYIDKVESSHPLRTSSRIGQRAPLHAGAAGKSILAFLGAEEVGALLDGAPLERVGPRTITDPVRLERELSAIRRRGYAVSVEEINPGVTGVGAPIFGADGRPIGAISVTGPRVRFTGQEIRKIAAILLGKLPPGGRGRR